MNLYKAHVVHPHTQIPLIIYFNERDGFVTFEKDEDVLSILLELKVDIAQDEYFLTNLEKVSSICLTQYPVDNLEAVMGFLDEVGINVEEINFKQVLIH
ncbi:hypothetical protein [Bacillus sp. FJAT-45037]|uniref:hypothetical protein n=1 Tax=Bacillus sp. FJAT-45037 TaxID=2011007 RepID=UPI000C250C94|nr:hypothetical protein [Bacillus sp. FJAT-45037]